MFKRVIDRLSRVRLNDVTMTAVSDLSDEIAEMNRQQMWSGEDSDGNQMQPSYARSTIRRKRRKNQPVNRVTLKDSGEFHDSITAKATKSAVVIESHRKAGSFDLADHLDSRYGTNASIYGLNEKNRRRLKAQLIPLIKKELLRNVTKS